MQKVIRSSIHLQVEEIISELKRNKLWKNIEPKWVNDYEAHAAIYHHDFLEWLQFVYLPNCLQKNTGQANSVVPQATKHFFSHEVNKGKLLQLLIELDALV